MATGRLVWDKVGERLYETGTKKGVLFVQKADGTYEDGVAWNGLTGVSEAPSGADPTDQWADDIKYLVMRSAEEFGFTISAFTYPDEWEVCDGSAEPVKGVRVGQQSRKAFGFSYVSTVGNDTEMNDHGYKIHLFYNCTVSPSNRDYSTINDSPDALEFSWEAECTMADLTYDKATINDRIGTTADLTALDKLLEKLKPTCELSIDSTKVDPEKLKAFEDILYGTDEKAPTLLLPAEVIAFFNAAA